MLSKGNQSFITREYFEFNLINSMEDKLRKPRQQPTFRGYVRYRNQAQEGVLEKISWASPSKLLIAVNPHIYCVGNTLVSWNNTPDWAGATFLTGVYPRKSLQGHAIQSITSASIANPT